MNAARVVRTGMGAAGRAAGGGWVILASQVVELITPLLRDQRNSRQSARIKGLEARVEALEAHLRGSALPPALPPAIDETGQSG